MNVLASRDSISVDSRLLPAAGSRHDLRHTLDSSENCPAWCLGTFAGRLLELSGKPAGAALSLAFRLVLEAQQLAEPVAWITGRKSTFFPPDAADRGIDLAALAVISARDILAGARAAEHLLRSSAFGLLVWDLGRDARLPMHALARLAGQARLHETALLFLTEKPKSGASLGSLVSLRAHTRGIQRHGPRFRCQARILKDKRRGPGWSHVEVCSGPDGLC